jgi:hypothetical protein
MAADTSRTWFIIPAAVVLTVVLGVWMARQATPTSRDHAGQDDVLVTLGAPEGGGEAAARALVERLVLLGVEGRVEQASDRELSLRLRRVAEAEELLTSLLDPEPLAFHFIPEPQRAGADAGEVDEDNPTPWTLGEGRAATRARAEPAALDPEQRFITECIPPRPKGTPPPCALWKVGPPVALGAADVVDTALGAHRQTEEPMVTLTFRPEAKERLRALREAGPGNMVAVVAFGELAARPRLNEHNLPDLEDGTWRFSTRTGDTDRRTAVERAQRIGVAARLPRLPPLIVRDVQARNRQLP